MTHYLHLFDMHEKISFVFFFCFFTIANPGCLLFPWHSNAHSCHHPSQPLHTSSQMVKTKNPLLVSRDFYAFLSRGHLHLSIFLLCDQKIPLETHMMYLGSTLTNRSWLFNPFKFIGRNSLDVADEDDFRMQTRMPI